MQVKSLFRIIAESKGRVMEEIYRNADAGILEDVNLLQDTLYYIISYYDILYYII